MRFVPDVIHIPDKGSERRPDDIRKKLLSLHWISLNFLSNHLVLCTCIQSSYPEHAWGILLFVKPRTTYGQLSRLPIHAVSRIRLSIKSIKPPWSSCTSLLCNPYHSHLIVSPWLALTDTTRHTLIITIIQQNLPFLISRHKLCI